jgi:general secretion pathway protein A
VSPTNDLKRALSSAGSDAPRHAWAGLYRLWGVQADVLGDEQACAQAPAVGLRCLQGGGSWTVLTQLDRPAILLLADDQGRRVPVLLQELLGDKARIQVDGREMVEPVDVLKQSWFGRYRVLWKTPPKGSAVLRPGDQGSDVAWLRQQLQQATGMRSIAPNPTQYDAGLEELVRSFQRDNALNVDGVAGPRTMIYLNTLEKRPSVPRLGVVKG